MDLLSTLRFSDSKSLRFEDQIDFFLCLLFVVVVARYVQPWDFDTAESWYQEYFPDQLTVRF